MATNIIESSISFAEKNEGVFYGDGTGILLRRIATDLKEAAASGGRMTPRRTRKVVTKTLRRFAKELGMDPDIEVASRGREVRGFIGEGEEYVGFEAGPFDWAIQASWVVMEATGLLAEPYYGFDLCISER